MKTIDQANIKTSTRVLLRADFNVAVQNGKVVDDFQDKEDAPTLDFLKKKGANVVMVSHIENAAGSKDKATLQPVIEALNKLGFSCAFAETIEDAVKKSTGQEAGFVLLENIRNYPGETANDPAFAVQLAALGDIYMNDAFSVSHRAHASIVGVPKLLPHFAGFQLALEVENLSLAFNPSHPFLFILGGAKFDTKLPLVEKFLDKADTIFIGGALANDLFKAKGFEVGRSTISQASKDFDGLLSNIKIILPIDVVVDSVGEQKLSNQTKFQKMKRYSMPGQKPLLYLKKK